MVHQSNATHVAPLGLGVIWLTVYYKHAAPLGLNEVKRNGTQICVPYELHSSGARGLTLPRFYRHIAPLERKTYLTGGETPSLRETDGFSMLRRLR